MSRTSCLRCFVLCSCGILFLAGCSANQGASLAPRGGAAAGTTTSPPSALPPATQKNLYVVQAGGNPVSTLVFPLTAHGSATPTLEIPGSQVAVDGAGNIYVLDQKGYPDFTVTSINVYSADSPTMKPIRSLPVGPGTKISAVRTMTVSPAGEIFVSDTKGIAVFSPTATGDADPVRYIQDFGVEGFSAASWASFMAVDKAGNLYAGNYGSPVFVFGPKDTGPVAPSRIIAGSLTQMGVAGCNGGSAMFGMTVDDSGDLYVLYRCQMDRYAPASSLAVYEFAPNANGNVSPIRTFTTPGMGIYYAGTGLAVDSAGTVYVSASYQVGSYGFVPAVFEFPATASGTVTPSSILTSIAWSRYPPPPGEDGWFDPSGSIAVH
jgi:hypothetical protein